jgi:AcrR family transcriptional regulator
MMTDMTTSATLGFPESGTAHNLLVSAASVFVRNGYANTTVGEIAAEAGATRPTFYSYFESKEDVFRRLAERVRQEFLSFQSIDPKRQIGEIIRQTDREYLRIYTANEPLLTVIKHQSLGDASMNTLWRDIHRLPNFRHSRFIEAQVALGCVDPIISPDSVAEAITGIVMRFSEILGQSPQRFEELLDELVCAHLALLGIATRTS